MQIEIALEKLPKGQAVTPRGRLDAVGTPAFTGTMEGLLKDGETTILIDCSELRYVSSMALGAFVDYGKRLAAANGAIAFAALNPQVRTIFKMVGFLTIFEVYDSRQDALASPHFRADA
jgi:anti-anti-sigma factor